MALTYRLQRSQEILGDLVIELETLANLNETIDALFEKLEREGRPELLETLCTIDRTIKQAGVMN